MKLYTMAIPKHSVVPAKAFSSSRRRQGPNHRRRLFVEAGCPIALTDRPPRRMGPGGSPGRRADGPAGPGLIDRADQVLDLLRVRAKLLGELVEIGIGDRRKTLLVHILDDLDPERLQ